MKGTIFMFVMLIVATFASVGCSDQISTENTRNIEFFVKNENTNEPAEGVLVYIGQGEKYCRTGADGICTISGLFEGNTNIGLYHKNYRRLLTSFNLDAHTKSMNMLIDEKPTPPEVKTFEGLVEKRLTGEGTRNERYEWWLLLDNNSYLIFNEFGRNDDYGYGGKVVSISGYIDKGFKAFDNMGYDGVYVITIEET